MNRKGVSGVVSTILFVLLALGAVMLVWGVVRNVIYEAEAQIEPDPVGEPSSPPDYHEAPWSFCIHHNMQYHEEGFIQECVKIENDTIVEKWELDRVDGLWYFAERII